MGLKKIYTHELELCRYLYKELSKIEKVKLYTPEPTFGAYAPVVSFNIYGKTSGDVAQYLSENGIAVRAGLHCAPSAHKQIGTLESGTVRAAAATFNTPIEIKAFVKTLKNAEFI